MIYVLIIERRRTQMTTKTFPEIAAEYAPYHTMQAFQVGAEAFMDHRYTHRYSSDSVEAQAWDRGHEAAMRFTKQHGGR